MSNHSVQATDTLRALTAVFNHFEFARPRRRERGGPEAELSRNPPFVRVVEAEVSESGNCA